MHDGTNFDVFATDRTVDAPLDEELRAMLPVVACFVADVKRSRNISVGKKRIASALVGSRAGNTWEMLHEVPGYGILADRCNRDEIFAMIDELIAWDVLRMGGDYLVRSGPNIQDMLVDVNLDDIRPRRLRATHRRARREPLPTVPAAGEDLEHMRRIVDFVNEEIFVVGHGYGTTKMVKALRGENTRDLDGTQLRELAGFGSLKGLDCRTVRRLLETLLVVGVLRRAKYATVEPPRDADSAVMPDGLDRMVDPVAFDRIMDERKRSLSSAV